MRDDDDGMMKEIARELRAPLVAAVSGSFDARVMAAVRRLPRHSRFRLWSRLTTPRTVTVMPLSWGLVAASLALFAVLGAMRAFDDIQVATQADGHGALSEHAERRSHRSASSSSSSRRTPRRSRSSATSTDGTPITPAIRRSIAAVAYGP